MMCGKGAHVAQRVVGYVRVSTDEQAREGVSLDAQRHRITAYAEAMALDLVAVEADEGVSGSVAPDKRPGLARALRRLRCRSKDKAGGLVVLKLDRLSRSTRDVLELVDDSGRRGWRLVSVAEALDTGSPAGRLVVTVLAALAQLEREQIGERTAAGMEQLAREGRGRSRWTPFGWRSSTGSTELRAGDREQLIPDAAEQEQLAAILELRDRGYGARRICGALRAVNTRTGRPWSTSTMHSLLQRCARWQQAGAAVLA